jgi:branched-chain amino acid transport system permease protein
VWLAVLLTLLISLVIGALTERLLIRRFEGQEPLVAIVATVAVLICFNGLINLVWGGSVRAFPSLFPTTSCRSSAPGPPGATSARSPCWSAPS